MVIEPSLVVCYDQDQRLEPTMRNELDLRSWWSSCLNEEKNFVKRLQENGICS